MKKEVTRTLAVGDVIVSKNRHGRYGFNRMIDDSIVVSDSTELRIVVATSTETVQHIDGNYERTSYRLFNAKYGVMGDTFYYAEVLAGTTNVIGLLPEDSLNKLKDTGNKPITMRDVLQLEEPLIYDPCLLETIEKIEAMRGKEGYDTDTVTAILDLIVENN